MGTTNETLEDATGRVEIAWAEPAVLYVRVTGVLSNGLGRDFAARLGALALDHENIQYFADMSSLTAYELMARSAFVRMVLQHRRRFTSFVVLTWAEGTSTAANSIAEVIGEGLQVLTDSTEFQVRLMQAAPQARHWLGGPSKPRRSRRPRSDS
jgi:hypothetical protein